MTRSARYRLLYLISLLIFGAAALGIVVSLSPADRMLGVLVVVAVLLIPGRIQGFAFRDHYRGRRLLEAGQTEAAIKHCERFLAQIRAKPWQKRLIWFAGVIYSANIEAMTLNNLGVAHQHRGDWDESRRCLEQALSLDPQYPIPQFNLAVVAAACDDQNGSQQYLDEAHLLGYRRTRLDQVMQVAQQILASVEGRGEAANRDVES